MRVPRIAGVDLSWALAMLFILPGMVYFQLSGSTDNFDAFNFDLIQDFFFALLFFSHGVFSGALLVSVHSNSRVNRFLVTQGIVYLIVGIVLELYFSVNFMMILGSYYLLSRIVIYLDNQIVRFMLLMVAVTGILLFSFGRSEWGAEEVIGGTVVNNFLSRLTEHHFNLVHWAPIFLAGLLFGRSDFQSGRRAGEIRLMAIVLILFGVVLHIVGLRIFHVDTAFASFWEVRFPISLPAFYAFSIGACQLLVPVLDSAYKRSNSKSRWTAILNTGRLHLPTILKTAIISIFISKFVSTTGNERLWSVLISMGFLGLLYFVPMLKKTKDPLLYFSKVSFSKTENDTNLQAGDRK